tara:strand:- start:64 stop:1074 length:1011 start_codon:yes stop_codon:yes gene_type:complete
MFKNKSLLITGGTGSFGNQLLKKIIKDKLPFKEIVILSRDEKKQHDMRKLYNNSNIKFHIGDVRDVECTDLVTKNIDYIFHAAALKQVPSCEFYPMEAIKTNIMGTNNILNSAINNKVKKVVCLSTDKSVYPINAMGISKAMMEKVAISKSLLKQNSTSICVTRYGNVIGSRGSILPLIFDQIKKDEPITITNKDMTRFLMTLDDALELVFYAFKVGKNGQLFIKKSPSAKIETLVRAMLSIMNKKDYPINIIGTRHGEKMHETLLSKEEKVLSKENRDYYLINPDLRDLNYSKYYELGKISKVEKDYNSLENNLYNLEQTIKLLKESDFVKNLMK